MSKSLKWKTILLLLMIVFSGVIVMPSFNKNLPDWWQKYLAPEGLRLGLDLQGGMHLVLNVDLEKAIENTLDLSTQNLINQLAEKQVTVVRTPSSDPDQVVLTMPNTSAVSTVEEVVKGNFADDLDINIEANTGSFPRISLKLTEEKIKFINDVSK